MHPAPLVHRTEVIDALASHMDASDAYIIVPATDGSTAGLITALEDLHNWTAYVDCGTDAIAVTNAAAIVWVVAKLAPRIAMVVTIDKSESGDTLAEVLGIYAPEDDEQDIFILADQDGPLAWPMMFVSAVEKVDPDGAAMFYADAVPVQP